MPVVFMAVGEDTDGRVAIANPITAPTSNNNPPICTTHSHGRFLDDDLVFIGILSTQLGLSVFFYGTLVSHLISVDHRRVL